MDKAYIRRRIAEFPRWHYQFDIGGEFTPIHKLSCINRHKERRNYFFDPLIQLLGGSLKGARVLDLGCNAGFWSLCAVEAGCEFVLGIDGRAMHIEQADFVFEALGIEKRRYRFEQADVFNFNFQTCAPFDLVLCFGLLYHVNRPIDLLETIASVNSNLLAIDTSISRADGPFFELIYDDANDPRNAVNSGYVLWPTVKAVQSMVSRIGYNGVMLRPCFKCDEGVDDFIRGDRRAFICSKITDLQSLSQQAELMF